MIWYDAPVDLVNGDLSERLVSVLLANGLDLRGTGGKITDERMVKGKL